MSSSGYKFQITNNQITQVFEVDRYGRLERETIDWDESYTLDGLDVIKTETDHGGVEITRYSDVNGDGLFFKVSESNSDPTYTGQNTGHQDTDHSANGGSSDWNEQPDNDYGSGSGSDHGMDNDHNDQGSNTLVFTGTQPAHATAQSIMVIDGSAATGSTGADHFVVSQLQGNLIIRGFNGAQGDQLVFDLDNGIQTLAQLASQVSDLTMNGQDMVIGFNGGSAHVVLVGIGPFGIGLEHVSVV